MQKTYRDFTGVPIRERLTKRLLGRANDFVVNPANGEVVAIFARRDRTVLLPTTDILRVSGGVIWVEHREALAAPDEIIRIGEIIRLHTPILGNKVFTVGRQYLGEVINFHFETNGWVLTRIEVAKKILTIPTARKLINSSQIVRIKPTEITVRDTVVKVRARRADQSESAESDLSAATFKAQK